jgi:hypothetical protein
VTVSITADALLAEIEALVGVVAARDSLERELRDSSEEPVAAPILENLEGADEVTSGVRSKTLAGRLSRGGRMSAEVAGA